MEVSEHIVALQREGALLADASERVDLDAAIPTCPDWRVRDLLQHIGGVHRWAATTVREHRAEAVDDLEDPPSDNALRQWFRDGHAALVATLTAAPSDLECFTFLAAPSPLAFWSRRQAHETAIHRADAESASGAVTEYAPELAADGIDELLFGFASRPRRKGLPVDATRSVHLHAADVERDWMIHLSPDGITVMDEPDDDEPDCAVQGPASDLYLLLWNRRDVDGLNVVGEGELLGLWRETVRVRWT
jgi:uncharacterized protein (TIGR03083 family)